MAVDVAALAAGIGAGVNGILTYFAVTGVAERSTSSGGLPAVIVALLCAARLAVLARRSPAAGRLDTAEVG